MTTTDNGERVRARPRVMDTRFFGWALKHYAKANVWLYRKTSGRIGGKWRLGSAFPRGTAICLLTTTGRRSGLARTTPLIYMRDGADLILVGSQGGLPTHPLWYNNLQHTPAVVVQVKGQILQMRARTAGAVERSMLWPLLVETYADFDSYQSWTPRQIPVVICERIDEQK